MTIIEQIKAYIERQIKDPIGYCYGVSSINKLKELLDFIDAIESEKPVPADLEVEHNVHEKEVNEMLAKIDKEALSELSEKPMNPDEFKKEIEKTWLEYECYNEDYDKVAEMRWNEFENVARHFYELGKQSISPEIHNDLEKAAISRMRDPDMYLSEAVIDEIGDALLKMAEFGAKWQAKLMKDEEEKK